MSYKYTGFATVCHGPSVPHSQRLVVAPRIEDMRRHLIAETYGVDVVRVVREADGRLPALEIVDDDGVVGGAGNDLAAIAREPQGPDAEVVAAHVAVATSAGAGGAGREVGEVEEGVVGLVEGVGGGKADSVPDGGVGEIAVVRAEGGVGDGPLAERVVDGLVVFPVVRIGGVVHADLEVLSAGEEEVAVVGELAAVGAGVVVDDLVSHGGRGNEVLRDQAALATHGGARIEAKTPPHETLVEIGSTSTARVHMGVTETVGAGVH